MKNNKSFLASLIEKFKSKNADTEQKVDTNSEKTYSTAPSEIQNSKETNRKELEKIKINYDQLDINAVLNRYLSNAHYSVPSVYDYDTYKIAEFDCMIANLKKVNIELKETKLLRQKASSLNYTKSKNIISTTNLQKIKDFIAIDTETTGLKTAYNDIIEISAIKFVDFRPTELFTTLLKPRRPIPIEATSINGITDEMVKNAPKFSQIYDSLVTFLANYPIVMHNAPFDLKFLCASGFVIDAEKRDIFDTLELSRRCIKDYEDEPLDNYKLATVCEEQCIFFNGAHRSTADALATGLLFNEIVRIKKDIKNLVF